jgi:CRISPR-associated protein Cmr3
MAKPKKKHTGGKINYKKQAKQSSAPAPRSLTLLESSPTDELSLHIQAHDTWFFRESRPHDAVGASELNSLFPPPVRTLAGALRTFIGDQFGIDWAHLNAPNEGFDFTASLGDSDDLGQLQIQGLWVTHQGQRLYPAPLYLMQNNQTLQRLRIGSAVSCDLGCVRLPELPPGCQGYKAIESGWLTAQGLRACLEGRIPDRKELLTLNQLLDFEARLGIARDNTRRSVHQGQLYQTRHLRLKETTGLELCIQHPQAESWLAQWGQSQPLIRFGGEGRMAYLNPQREREKTPFTQAKATTTFALHFMTPADFKGQLFPAEWDQQTRQNLTVWAGEINGIAFQIEAAVIGKAYREGGWDMQRHQPRPVKSYVPAGSVWFCRLAEKTDWQTLHRALHEQNIGEEQELGRGQILLGQWLDDSF